MPDVSNLTLSGARPGQGQTNEVGNFQMSLLGHFNLPATIGLADARNRTREAREQLAHGLDPGREKQKAKLRAQLEANNSFSAIAKEYCEKRKRDGAKAWAPATSRRCEYLLSLLSGSIGKLPITDIEPIDVLEAVRRIERQGKHESSRRTMQLAGAVFRYAVATARVRSDPTRDLRGALIVPTVTHYGAIIDPDRVGALMRAIDAYDGQPITRLAMQLAPHVFVRPGELRHAEWHEFDLEGALWTIPADKTKMRKDHRVPLSRQSIAILEETYALTGPKGYVFPSIRTRKRPMSDNTINAALRRLGYVRRWQIEVTFAETRAHLGVETQRQWTDKAIARTTPALLGLYSLISLWACDLLTTKSTPYSAAWYRKTSLTFSDAIGAVRLQLWVGDINQHSPPHPEPHYIPTTRLKRMAQALCFAT